MLVRRPQIVLAIVLVVVLVALWQLRTHGLGLILGNSRNSSEQDIDGLVVHSAHLAPGEIWEDKAFRWPLPIENRSDAPIAIKHFETSCFCVSVDPKSVTIAPREKRTVTVTLDTRVRDPKEIGKSAHELTEILEPIVQGSAGGRARNRSYWKLTASVRRRLTFDMLSLSFGNRPVHGHPPVARKTVVTIHVPYQELSARVQPDVAAVRTVKQDDSTFVIHVAPRTDMRPGRFQAELVVELTDEKGNSCKAGWLPIDGELRPEIRPVPARFTLSASPVGSTAEGMFLLQPDDEDLTLTTIATDKPELEIAPINVKGVPPGRAYAVRLRMTHTGDTSALANLTVQREAQEPKTYSMAVYCRGLAAAGR